MNALILITTLCLSAAASAQSNPPDIIYFHGNILTGAHLRSNDPSPTPAQVSALAIANGKVTAVGPDAVILKLKGPKTTLIDLHSAFAMPGFNDAHTHLFYGGLQKLNVDLDGVKSLAEMQQRIKTFAAAAKPGSWLKGAGWDHTIWTTKQLPTRLDIDSVTAGHPAILFRTDEHIAVVNTAALAAANITRDTPDPFGARIDHDADGNPTGIIREVAALNLVTSKIPPLTSDDRRVTLNYAIADALSHGVTSVQDYSTWDDFLMFEEFEHAGKLHLRVSEWLDFTLPLAVLKERRASHPADDPLLHLSMLKGFMDGSLGSHTAAMEEPFSDDPKNSGIPGFKQDNLNQFSSERAAAGFQLGFHAIGDRANDMALNAFGAAEQVATSAPKAESPNNPDAGIVTSAPSPAPTPASLRFRIEHAQVLLPEDFDRYEKEGVIASMQPSHLLTDMNWANDRLGPERAKYAYAWKSFLDHNVVLAFGTDYPVESLNPFRGLYSAVTRQNEAGTMTFQPQEKISLNEAIYAYTQASAFAEFREHEKGRLEPGFLADLVVLDRDIRSTTPQQLLHTKVLRTVVNGQTVYSEESEKSVPGLVH